MHFDSTNLNPNKQQTLRQEEVERRYRWAKTKCEVKPWEEPITDSISQHALECSTQVI